MSISVIELAETGQADLLMRDMRVRSLWSPYYLSKMVLGYKQMVDYLHLKDSELFIQRWMQGCTKQWIEWPRGFFKTSLFTISTSIWVVLPYTDEDTDYALNYLGLDEGEWFARMALHDQDATQLLAMETIDNAKKKIAEIQYHFEENSLFRSLFPEIAYEGSEKPWNSTCLKIRRSGDGQRVEEGTFEAIGVDGALQSRHYKIVWEDDLVGKAATDSATLMEKTIRWHGLLHGAFENAAKQIRFGVSNRWGYYDLNSHIRANESDFVFHTRSAWEVDPESGQEVAIFPDRYTLEALFKIRDKGSMSRYDFFCQYLNQPKPPGEREISTAGLHTYTVESDGRIRCDCGASFYPSQLLRFMHYDPYNAKGVRSGSCPALAVVGTSTDKHVILLDYFLGKQNYGGVYDKIFKFNDVWRPIKFTYEDVGHQNMTEFYIRSQEKNPEHKHAKLPTIQGVPTKGKAKEVRIRDSFFPVLEKGKFSRRRTALVFDQMLETFPFSVPGHDYDLLDCLAQGATVWRFPVSEDDERGSKQEEDAYLANLGKPYGHTAEVR